MEGETWEIWSRVVMSGSQRFRVTRGPVLNRNNFCFASTHPWCREQ